MHFQPFTRIFPPCPALRGFVNSYFIGNDATQSLRCLPAFPHQYLNFYPYTPQQYSQDGGKSFEKTPSQLLVGPYTGPVYLDTPASSLIIMVIFVPGALYRLTHIPQHKIRNIPLDGINGFSNEIKRVSEQLSEAKTPEQMISIIENFLLKKIQKAKEELPIDQALKMLNNDPYQYTIDEIYNISYVCFRHFERLFKEHLGTDPTTFIRQARFKKAYNLKKAQPKLRWNDIADKCGYYDQPHLNRDYKEFSGATPTRFKDVISGESIKPDHLISLDMGI